MKCLQNYKIFGWTKLKAYAEVKSNVDYLMISLFGRAEDIVGKGENAGYQHFLLYPQCFTNPSSLGSLRVGIIGKYLS